MGEVTALTREWPFLCRPLTTERTLQRVKRVTTVNLYLNMLLQFLHFVVAVGGLLSYVTSDGLASLAALAARFIISLTNAHVRVFHSVFGFFWPDVPKGRLTAELKGGENLHDPTHTTPCSERLMLGLTLFVKGRLGQRCATGVLVTFAGLLRTCEAVRIRVSHHFVS